MVNRDELFAKITQCPETMTEQEIDLTMSDPELARTYNASVALMRSGMEIPEYDVEAGLRDIHSKMHTGRSYHTAWLRRAAAAAGICISIAAIAGIWLMRDSGNDHQAAPAPMAQPAIAPDTAPDAMGYDTTALRYDDTPLEAIIDDVCRIYGCHAIWQRPETRTLRLHVTIPASATPTDAVNILNDFDDIDISISGQDIYVK